MKTKIFLLCGFLLATTFLLAQTKRKTEKYFFQELQNGKPVPKSGRTNLYLYTPVSGAVSCQEEWDTLIKNKPNYSVSHYDYDNVTGSSSSISKHYYFNESSSKVLKKYEMGLSKYDRNARNRTSQKVYFDSDGTVLDKEKDSIFLSLYNNPLDVFKFGYDKSTNSFYPLRIESDYYNSNNCFSGSYFVVFQGKDTAYWATRKIDRPNDFDCTMPSKIEIIYWNVLQKKTTTHSIAKKTYKNNGKDVFTRYYSPILDCDYGAVDSTHEVLSVIASTPTTSAAILQRCETWYRDSSYEDNTLSFDGGGGLPLKKRLVSPNNFSTQSFYHYDKYNNLETEEIYRIINGKIDSTTRRILKKNYIIYDVGGRMLYGKYTDSEGEYGNYETFNKYNCNSLIVESKTLNKYHISINSYTYYDDNCDKSTVSDMNFSIYPNPTSDKIKIKTGIGLTFDKIQIYNPLGVLMKETEIDECDIEVETDVKDLNQGLYYLKISSKEGEQRFASKPFMKVN